MKGAVIWLTGLAGAGKTSFARALHAHLKAAQKSVILIDGDEIREIFDESAYERGARLKMGRKIHALARFLERNEIIVIVAVIGLFEEIFALNRANFTNYLEIYIKCDFAELARRDKKGLYSGALCGEIKNVVGVDIAFDEPRAHFVLENSALTDFESKANRLFKRVDEFLGVG